MTKTVIKIDSTKLQKQIKDVSLRIQNLCKSNTSNSSTKRHNYVRMTLFL